MVRANRPNTTEAATCWLRLPSRRKPKSVRAKADTPAITESTRLLIFPTVEAMIGGVSCPVLPRHPPQARVAGAGYAGGVTISYPSTTLPPQNDVERARPTVPRMGVAHRGDVAGVPRGVKPVADGGPDCAALRRPLGTGRLAGDEEQKPRPRADGLLQPPVEQVVGGGEVVAVQVEHGVGRHQPAAETAVPAAVEGFAGGFARRRGRRRRRCAPAKAGVRLHWRLLGPRRRRNAGQGDSVERPHRLDDPGPQFRLVRA